MKKILLLFLLFASMKAFSQVSTPLTMVVVDSSGTPITYQWSQVSGTNNVTLSSTTLSNITATFTVTGVYVIQCKASNGLGSTVIAKVTATVVPKIAGSIIPDKVTLTLQDP